MDTLVKLCADHFDSTEIEAARQMLYNYDAIKILDIKKSRRRQGPTKDRYNIEDMLPTLHKCRSGVPTFAVSELASLPTLDANGIDFGHTIRVSCHAGRNGQPPTPSGQ